MLFLRSSLSVSLIGVARRFERSVLVVVVFDSTMFVYGCVSMMLSVRVFGDMLCLVVVVLSAGEWLVVVSCLLVRFFLM